MSKTVVGLFPSVNEAQTVKSELVSQGFPAGNIQVMADDGAGTTDRNYRSDANASETGFGAKISNFFHSLTGGEQDAPQYARRVQSGGALLSLRVQDGQEQQATTLLEQYGAQDVEDESWGATASTGSQTLRGETASPRGETAIPIVEEELQVGKRQVQRGGVRVYSHLVETPVEEEVRLREEQVNVNRRAVNRPATEADFAAFKEGTIELTETGEQAVVSKSARVVEEVSLDKQATERVQTVKDTVRRTEVEVEHLGDKNPDLDDNYETARTGR